MSVDREKSNAVPGVLGVLLALPKDANAPLPRPNADDAPEVGVGAVLVDMLPNELKGFLELWLLCVPP